MTLTPQQKEAAARAICRHRGIDPDSPQEEAEAPTDSKGYTYDCILFSPAWTFVLRELEADEMKMWAVEMAVKRRVLATGLSR